MTIKITNAAYNDITDLLFLGKKMHAESRYCVFDFNVDKCLGLLTRLIGSEHGIVLVAKCKNETIGMFAGVVQEHFFGHSSSSSDLFFYIIPEHRNGKTANLLLHEYIDIANKMGVDDIRVGNSTGVMTERVGRLYESNGFINVGANYTLKGKHSNV